MGFLPTAARQASHHLGQLCALSRCHVTVDADSDPERARRKGALAPPLPLAPSAAVPLTPVTAFSADVPKEQQLQAVQAAVLLLADESREVLQTLLCFLNDVVHAVEENQMTPMNLAVCLAPSLFHLNLLKKESSPRWVFLSKNPNPKPGIPHGYLKTLLLYFKLGICQHFIHNQKMFGGT